MKRDRIFFILKIAGLFGCLYLFLVGIGGMGEAFKLFGAEVSEKILAATANPVISLFIGILATVLVQSSSTSSSIIVGMVAAGAITIEGAVPMIMGANIGTTVTSKLVSLGHITRIHEFRRAFAAASVHDTFNIITVAILFPLEMAFGVLSRSASFLAELLRGAGGLKMANPIKILTNPAIDFISWVVRESALLVLVISVLITFLMLWLLVKLLRSLVLEKLEAFFDEYLFANAGRAMLVGFLMTVAVQSSSITTSMIIPLAGAGILRLVQIFPFTVGANVGTTVTAMLAALSTGMEEAVLVAFAHLLFNLFGAAVVWSVPGLRHVPIRVAEKLAEFASKNRLIPVLIIILIFYVIPLIITWKTVSRAFAD